MNVSIEELRRECVSVRKAAHCVYVEKGISHFCIADFPKGWCGCLGRVLAAELSRKYPQEIFYYVCGEIHYSDGNWASHAWVRYNDWIIDITADQFAEVDKPITIVRVSDSGFHDRFFITNEHIAEKNVERYYEERIVISKKLELERHKNEY